MPTVRKALEKVGFSPERQDMAISELSGGSSIVPRLALDGANVVTNASALAQAGE